MSEKIRVVICGAGSGAHTLAGLFSLSTDVDVRVLILDPNKARRWNEQMSIQPLAMTLRPEVSSEDLIYQANSFAVTDDPKQAACHCDMVILVLPAFLHLDYLTRLAPYIEPGCVIIGCPGQNGFEFDVRYALGSKIKRCILINFESLPWVCRTIEFGRKVGILSTKSKLIGASQGDHSRARVSNPLAFLQNLIGSTPELILSGHLLGMTLVSPNAYCHPPIMYGRWKDWDGKPLLEPPLFYQAIDKYTADLIDLLSTEVLSIRHQIEAEIPHIDLSEVISIYKWDIVHYETYISDKTSTLTVNQTNSAYNGLTHPMTPTANRAYIPNFKSRYMTEDVPFGLVTIRGIAEISRVQTPYIDLVLSWCQEKLGKEYLVGSRLIGKDLGSTRCPQRYGFTTLSQILGID